MSETGDQGTPDLVSARLRANLRAAGIPFGEAEIETIIERGYLRTVRQFEALVAAAPSDTLPDYLASRGPVQPASAVEGAAGGALPLPTAAVPPGLHDTGGDFGSIGELAPLVRRGEISPVELTERALAAIDVADSTLNAFQVVLRERALAAARRAEAEIRQGRYRGPLHGVPLAAKDLFAMAGTVTTAGSAILGRWRTDWDAASVARLEAAGSVIVGKTRMSEFAYSPGSNNAHYGPTRNPWNTARDTGGSSSGSGAAVAAGLVYGALGTDTGGSIRIPASLCGIVGLKPTHGRCSLHGGTTLSWSLDHVGPLARSVGDAAFILEALAGHDPRDIRTRRLSEYRSMDLERGVAGLRIGVLRADGSGRPLGTDETIAAWHGGLGALERSGAELVELDLPELEAMRVVASSLLVLEAAAFHQRWLRERLHDYGEFPRHRLLFAYGYGPLAAVQAGQLRERLRAQLDAVFDRVDLVSTPTMPYDAPALGIPAATTFTAPFNLLGWPAISVPVGRSVAGLPLGLQLAGRPWDDATVLRAARSVEAFGPWRAATEP